MKGGKIMNLQKLGIGLDIALIGILVFDGFAISYYAFEDKKLRKAEEHLHETMMGIKETITGIREDSKSKK
jgi:hypothetical protein